jgi:uncharacterized protein VirK/YbjX
LCALTPLLLAPRGSTLHRFVKARPEVFAMVLTPYVAANWNVQTRLVRIVDHCKTVAEIGGVVSFSPEIIVDLVRLKVIDSRYRLTLDQARWLLPEGQLVMSLWDGVDRIFHLAFCLSTQNGKIIAYIGAVQGRAEIVSSGSETNILGRYRIFTKAASGMRPRDFLVEVFKMFCRAIGVSEIRAVSDHNYPGRQLISAFKLSYDAVWRERGGNYDGDGFFLLPVTASRRNDEDIPAKKRAMYRKRYSVLDAIEKDLTVALKFGEFGQEQAITSDENI